MDWIKEIEIEDLLTNDSRLIYEHCGTEVLLMLWQRLPNLNLYISTKPLMELKKRYIKKFYNGSNLKQLAALLEVSDRFIYDVIAGNGVTDERQGKLI